MGLGMVAIGLVILCMGLGEKGFKTVEMSLVGPGLVVGGLVLSCLRICCCFVGESLKDVDEEHEDGNIDKLEEQNKHRNGFQNNDKLKGDNYCLHINQPFTVSNNTSIW